MTRIRFLSRPAASLALLALLAAGLGSAPARAQAPLPAGAAAVMRCPDTSESGDILQAVGRDFKPGVAPRLFLALGKERHALLKKVLAAGDDPNICHAGLSPLLAAVGGGDLRAATLLLDAGARPDNPRDSNGGTPLHYALGMPPLEIAALLLDRGADPQVLNAGRMTTLHSLALQAVPAAGQRALQVALADRLLRQGVPVDAVHVQGSTALHMAISAGNLDLMNLLIEHGANPALRNKAGEDALAYARRRGHATLVQRLEQLLAGKTAAASTRAAQQ